LIYQLVIFAMVILFCLPAEAQVQTGMTAPSLLIPLEPPEALPPSGAQAGYLFNLRPLGADFGRTLADNGVYLVARDLSEVLGNVSGGRKQGGSFERYTALGFDLDMERLAGITGGSIHFLLDDLQG
jgi:carbohydrate-selective porin OprB